MDHTHSTVAPMLAQLVGEIRGVLGGDLLGVYLYGSLVSGGFDAGISDLDLVAVTSVEVEELDLAGLDRMQRDFTSRPAWTDRLEIVYISRRTLASFRTSPGSLAVISPGESFHVAGPAVDWLQNWYLVRETGVTLFGPPASTVVPPIAHSEFLAAVARYADWLRHWSHEDLGPGNLAYAVLSLCRALRTVRTGAQCSKQAGAAWARQQVSEWAWLIDAALQCRLSRGAIGFDDEDTRAAAARLIGVLAAEIRTAVPT